MRARTVFAVADSEAWGDGTHGAGPFDSAAGRPAHRGDRRRPATVPFATDHTTDGRQTGDLSVLHATGAPPLVTSYRGGPDDFEILTVTLPAGVSTAQRRFRCTGTATGTGRASLTVDHVAVATGSRRVGGSVLPRPGRPARHAGAVRVPGGRPAGPARLAGPAVCCST